MRKILIADDDLISLSILNATLDPLGYEALVAHDGTEAWEMFKEHKPSFVILDWSMPGLTGLQICQRIRTSELLYPTYVMILTARDTSEDVIEALYSGVDEYLVKPINPHELRARIESGKRNLESQFILVDKSLELQAALERVKFLEEFLKDYVPSSNPPNFERESG